MNVLRTVWNAHFASLRNASRYDARIRIGAGIFLVFNISVGYWSIAQLLVRLQQWQALGQATLNTNLWFLCINVWVGMAFFSVIGMMRAMGSDEAVLLFTLPLPSAMRFRVFYSTFFIQNLWNWLLLEIGCVGYVLIATLGLQGFLWLLLLQCGTVVTVGGILILALLFIRYVLFPDKMKTRIITLALCATLGLTLVLYLLFQKREQGVLQSSLLLAHLNPVLVLFLLIGMFFLILGPLSGYLGKLYTTVFRSLQGGKNAKNAFTLPGILLVNKVLTSRGGLIPTLFAKSILNQSRNWLFWLRLVISVALIALFPLVRPFVAHYGFSEMLQVTAYATGVALWHILEVALGAISGEANRLTLYLTAPLKFTQIIRAKLVLFLFPVLVEGLLVTLFLSWQIGLSVNQLGFALIAVFCIITASVALPVLGSIWDEDLEVIVEGRMQAILQEEAPISPKRMGLLNLSILLFVGMLVILWKTPPFFALVSVIGSMVIVLMGMWRFCNVCFQRLSKG